MNHNQETSIEPINTSSNKFGVMYENQLVVLDDAKHVIGLDASDAGKIIIENIMNQKAYKIGWNDSSYYYISNLFYDEDTGSLYIGDRYNHLFKYKVEKTSNTCKRVKDYGDFGMGEISSSYRFKHFVFFGGNACKIRVLDLSTGEFLAGHLETLLRLVYSFQVCVKSQDEIYLAVSGQDPDYSEDKTDLFDLTDLLPKDLAIL